MIAYRVPTKAERQAEDSMAQQVEEDLWDDVWVMHGYETDDSTLAERLEQRWPDEMGVRYPASWDPTE